MFITGPLVAAVLACGFADPPPMAIRIVRTDGTPLARTRLQVWLPEPANTANELVTDENGKVRLDSLNQPSGMQLFVRDDAGRIGTLRVTGADDDDEVTVALLGTEFRNGRIFDAEGGPLVGATVQPVSYVHSDGRSDVRPWPSSITLPESERERLAVRTDADGRFTIRAPPDRYGVEFRVSAPGQGESRWLVKASAPLEFKLPRLGAAMVTLAIDDPAKARGLPWRLRPVDLDAQAGVIPLPHASGSLGARTELTLANLPPGKYELAVAASPTVPVIARRPVAFEVSSGVATKVALEFAPAATVTGKVIGPDGVGVGDVVLSIQPRTREESRSYLGQVTTAADGRYQIYGPAGWYVLYADAMPDGFAPPRHQERRDGHVDPAPVEAGGRLEYPPLRLERAVMFRGRVVTADGSPAAGAEVIAGKGADAYSRAPVFKCDDDGRFTIPNIPADDLVSLRVRLAYAVNVPEPTEAARTTPLAVVISEANAGTVTGRVVDQRGAPISGAHVKLVQRIRGVGRENRTGMQRVADHLRTDGNGRYEFKGLWPGDQYTAQVHASGYAKGQTSAAVADAGRTTAFPDVRLARTNLSVSGIVLGPTGEPLTGVELFSPDGPKRFSTRSGPDGRFTLTGFYDAAGFLFARAHGCRLAAMSVRPGDAVTVRMKPNAWEALPPISAEHRAADQKLTRHLLTRLWEGRVKAGYGGNAMEAMARFDPATARRWRDEERTRTGGKTTYTATMDAATRDERLMALAAGDIDDALAELEKVPGITGFWEVTRFGERLLAVDQAKAARVAEEAVVRARRGEGDEKVMWLAAAGELAARAGNTAGGWAVLREAAELAEKLPPTGKTGATRGYAASRVARFDWPRAEKLLDPLDDPSDFNRYLKAAAARLAVDDLPAASKLFGRLRPERGFTRWEAQTAVAIAVARQQPDAAESLVESIMAPVYRVRGRLALAAALGDRGRAWKLIDAAIDECETDRSAFSGWSSSGEAAGLGVHVAVKAQALGHPDTRGILDRALALRSAGSAYSGRPDERLDVLVYLAATTALVEPATARSLLACVAPPDEYPGLAVGRDRNWLFALALADPDRAMALVDRLIDESKPQADGRPALGRTGLIELTLILTKRDRFAELATFTGGFRDDWYED